MGLIVTEYWGARACVRGLRITVADVLRWLAAGMSHEEIVSDFSELTEADIRACLSHPMGHRDTW